MTDFCDTLDDDLTYDFTDLQATQVEQGEVLMLLSVFQI